MSQKEVVQSMGKPDGFQQRGEYTIYKYTNRLISGWSWDRTDYLFIFKDDKLIEYGSGEVRERNVGDCTLFSFSKCNHLTLNNQLHRNKYCCVHSSLFFIFPVNKVLELRRKHE